jgi:CRP-like cAMP-binding protein
MTHNFDCCSLVQQWTNRWTHIWWTSSLWRMFYWTGSLSQKLFKDTVAKYCKVVTFKEGQKEICTDEWFYIVYKGTVRITALDNSGAFIRSRKAQSGQLFDFCDLGLLQDVHKSLAWHWLEGIMATSESTLFHFPKDQIAQIASHQSTQPMCTLFHFPKDQIAQIASHQSTQLMWKELLMGNLLHIHLRRHISGMSHCNVTHIFLWYVIK